MSTAASQGLPERIPCNTAPAGLLREHTGWLKSILRLRELEELIVVQMVLEDKGYGGRRNVRNRSPYGLWLCMEPQSKTDRRSDMDRDS